MPRVCPCGCGIVLRDEPPQHRQAYASDACRARVLRALSHERRRASEATLLRAQAAFLEARTPEEVERAVHLGFAAAWRALGNEERAAACEEGVRPTR